MSDTGHKYSLVNHRSGTQLSLSYMTDGKPRRNMGWKYTLRRSLVLTFPYWNGSGQTYAYIESEHAPLSIMGGGLYAINTQRDEIRESN